MKEPDSARIIERTEADVEEENFYKECQKPEPTAPSIGPSPN